MGNTRNIQVHRFLLLYSIHLSNQSKGKKKNIKLDYRTHLNTNPGLIGEGGSGFDSPDHHPEGLPISLSWSFSASATPSSMFTFSPLLGFKKKKKIK